MAIQNVAVVDGKTQSVSNVIVIDPAVDIAPKGATYVPLANGILVSPGWKYNADGSFTNPSPAPVPVVPLATAQASQTAIIDAACAAAITNGYTSNALGAVYIYPSQQIDQLNMNASVLDALINQSTPNWKTQFACADANGVWAYRDHSAAQMIKVGQDAKAAILALRIKGATLKAQIAVATSVAAVQAIVW